MFGNEISYFAKIEKIKQDGIEKLKATFPDVAGIVAEADSISEVVEEARSLLTTHLARLTSKGERLPRVTEYLGDNYRKIVAKWFD